MSPKPKRRTSKIVLRTLGSLLLALAIYAGYEIASTYFLWKRGQQLEDQIKAAGARRSWRLNISCASLYKLCAQHQLPHVRVGNSIRFHPTDLAASLRSKR